MSQGSAGAEIAPAAFFVGSVDVAQLATLLSQPVDWFDMALRQHANDDEIATQARYCVTHRTGHPRALAHLSPPGVSRVR